MSAVSRMISSYVLALAAVLVPGGLSAWPQNPHPPVAAMAPRSIVSVAWSPDGNRLAPGGELGTAKVWDADTGEELISLDVRSPVWSIAWSPDGSRLATGNNPVKGNN